MERPDFNRVRNQAIAMLLELDVASFPLAIKDFLKLNKPIYSFQYYSEVTRMPVSSLTKNKKIAGTTIKLQTGRSIILYDDDLSPDRKLWTVTHEIGHDDLGHIKDGEVEEIEAHFFAAQLLMPDGVIMRIAKAGMNRIPHYIFTDYFGVSLDAAMKKLATLRRMSFTPDYRWTYNLRLDDFINKIVSENCSSQLSSTITQ